MKVNSKAKIINILKNSGEPTSGEEISRELGISRTAVWKNIKKLTEEGYTITSSATGYLLKKEDDLLNPYEFEEDNNLYIYRESTESTMDIARNLIVKGKAIDGTVVITDEQTKGKAKFGKQFVSPKGGLYFTMIFIPDSPVMDVNIYPMAGLAAVKEVLYEELDIKTLSKWPFESWYSGKKVSGILTEYKIENNHIKWLSLGIGINLKTTIPRREILIKIKKKINQYLQSRDTVLFYYINSLDIIDKTFAFETEEKITIGRVLSIDKLGTLSLETDDGLKFAYVGNSSQGDEI